MSLVGNVQLVAGDASTVGEVTKLLQKEGYTIDGNPDVYTRSHALFGVDEAREIRERAALHALSGRRIFVIAATTITAEAQNALLKTFEDAPGDALFFLIVPSPTMLLATIRSRAQVLELGLASAGSSDARAFLAAAPAARIDMLKPLLEKGDDDRRDVAGILAFLASLERALAGNATTAADALHAIYRARKYIGDRGALVKPLLEQLALLVPVMKV